jgi:hypothetical protein
MIQGVIGRVGKLTPSLETPIAATPSQNFCADGSRIANKKPTPGVATSVIATPPKDATLAQVSLRTTRHWETDAEGRDATEIHHI